MNEHPKRGSNKEIPSTPNPSHGVTLETCKEWMASSRPYEEKIHAFAAFLRHAEPHTDRDLLETAVECLAHLQFTYRSSRGHGMIPTENEYWAIRNVVWNIDKRIFWGAVGKRLVHLFHENRNQWLIYSDTSEQWEGYDADTWERTALGPLSAWIPWKRVLNEDTPPDFKWFEGAKTNLSFNSLDRHILQNPEPRYYRYWESESWGQPEAEDNLRLTHREYLFEVAKTVRALRSIGVRPEDRVALLMPEIPEAYYLIEAFHRMGVVYTSLPTSLGDQQVSDRIENLGVTYLFTVDGGWHKGKTVRYKKTLVDQALEGFSRRETVLPLLKALAAQDPEPKKSQEVMGSFENRFENKITINKKDLSDLLQNHGFDPPAVGKFMDELNREPDRVSKVVVYPRIGDAATPMKPNRDLDWHDDRFMGNIREEEIISAAETMLGREMAKPAFLDYGRLTPQEFLKVLHHLAPPEIVDGTHPRLVIYTSGSTGIPKGVVHCTLGHAIFGMYTMLVTMGPREQDLMDTRATHSWITGLDYIAGMPGLMGLESIVAEGAFDYERWLRRLARLRVNITKAGAPVLRGIKKFVESEPGRALLRQLDFSRLRVCVNCAEPADPVTQRMVNRVMGEHKYANTWWPTELTGPNTGVGTAHVPFAYPMKGDASTFPLPYVKQDVLSDDVDAEDRVMRTVPQETGILGRYVIDPHPGMLAGIHGDPAKFFESYFERYWNKTGDQIWYDSGDGGIRQKDGYFRIIGRVGYAFNWNGHISGAEDVEGNLRDHPAVRDVMIAPIKDASRDLDRLQVFLILNQGYGLTHDLKQEFDDLISEKKQKTFKGLMTQGSDYYPVDMYPVTMSQKSLRRFGSLLGSLSDRELTQIMGHLNDPITRSRVESGDETIIHDVFPTQKHQNPYAGSLVGLGNYPSLIHLTEVVAESRGLKPAWRKGG
jgi:acrylyl-CoA reductase (NADPH)/3-hydroxypropionyl-CoA dehydratase/3-hydroxypropionyl-CoA synthetase